MDPEQYTSGQDYDEADTDFPSFATPLVDANLSDGGIVDAVIVGDAEIEKPAERARRQRNSETIKTPREARTGPPSLDEWTRFISRVLLRVATEYYISFAFRGIDEDMLSEREVERLAMTDDEKQLIAVPFAEMANKSKLMRKHGRMIVASGDAMNALVVIGMWASRVNRIAARYRPRQPRTKVTLNGSGGQSTSESATSQGATGGRFPEGFNGYVQPGTG